MKVSTCSKTIGSAETVIDQINNYYGGNSGYCGLTYTQEHEGYTPYFVALKAKYYTKTGAQVPCIKIHLIVKGILTEVILNKIGDLCEGIGYQLACIDFLNSIMYFVHGC